MKIKTNFVTNSSSCNFVMIGYGIPVKRNVDGNLSLKSKRKILQGFNVGTNHLTRSEVESKFEEISRYINEVKINEEYGAPDEKTVLVGSEIFNWDSSIEIGSISIEDFLEEIRIVKTRFFFEEDPKFYFGTRAC